MWLVKQHPIARTVWKGSWAKNAVVELLYKRRKWWNFSYTLRHVYAWQFWAWCGYVRMILAVILASNKCVTGWCSMMFPILISNLCRVLILHDFAYQAISGSGHLPWVLTSFASSERCRDFSLSNVQVSGAVSCPTCDDSDHIGSSLTRQHVASDPVWHAQQHQLSFFQLGRLVPRLLMFSAWR